MSDNNVNIDGNVKESNVISGDRNTIIQIINKIYREEDLKELVISSFKNLADLQDFWTRTFPVAVPQSGYQESGLQYEALINDFKKNSEVARLLGEIKKRCPAEYRAFLSSQALNAVGLSTEQIPSDINMVERELLGLQRAAIPQQQTIPDDTLEFENRWKVFDKIRRLDGRSHVVIYGPSGVGKSYFLKHFQEKYRGDARCVLIDLNSCKPADILATAIEQLGGKPSGGYQELANIFDSLLHKTTPRINRCYFLFDNADQNQGAIDYLFCPDNIIENSDLHRLLEDWELLNKIQLKIIIAARYPVKTSTSYHASQTADWIEFGPLERDSVQSMLERLIRGKQHIPALPLNLISELSNEVYYLTGGHPKCVKQMLIALVERGCRRPTPDEWELLYKEHVIATIHAEMLKPIEPEFMSTIWSLSIFRRFDQRLLGGLLDRGILPNQSGDKSRQARELRTKLEAINLFDVEQTTDTIATNYVMRHALSLNMQHNAPNLYKTLNSLALELFLDRFQSSEAGIEKQIERTVVNLFEILYHWTKLLEVELKEENSQSGASSVYKRIEEALRNYLQMALTMIQNENQPSFFRFLITRWEEDKELQEAIRRITYREVNLKELAQSLQKENWEETV